MVRIAVSYTDTSQKNKAEQLAQALNLSVATWRDLAWYDFSLMLTSDRLELHCLREKNWRPVYVDFLSPKLRYRCQQGRMQELLARAVGIKAHLKPAVIDATAGLGQDGFRLATLGCKVLLLERSPIIGAMLADAIQRLFTQNPGFLQQIDPGTFRFIPQDACGYLKNLAVAELPEVIYLDPMFPTRDKTALVKKELRILREIVGEDSDAINLFSIALARARKRVVVKRPVLAPTLAGLKPDIVFKGKSCRFDVYTCRT